MEGVKIPLDLVKIFRLGGSCMRERERERRKEERSGASTWESVGVLRVNLGNFRLGRA